MKNRLHKLRRIMKCKFVCFKIKLIKITMYQVSSKLWSNKSMKNIVKDKYVQKYLKIFNYMELISNTTSKQVIFMHKFINSLNSWSNKLEWSRKLSLNPMICNNHQWLCPVKKILVILTCFTRMMMTFMKNKRMITLSKIPTGMITSKTGKALKEYSNIYTIIKKIN